MDLKVGEKVAYPNHGVCSVEKIEERQAGGLRLEFYTLRVLSNNSAIYVPKTNAQSVGIRPVISSLQCTELMKILGEDFCEGSDDWKVRVRDLSHKIQSGNIFEATDVLKQLTYLTHSKQLSFREQRLLEKAKFLVISELAIVCSQTEFEVENRVDGLLSRACQKHLKIKANAAVH